MLKAPKKAPIYDKKYRNSFKKHRAHKCVLTGHEWQEFDSVGVTACHITVGRHGWNIKDDSLILPLRQDLHMEMDKNQLQFWIKHFEEIPECARITAIESLAEKGEGFDLMEAVKQVARNYYYGWKEQSDVREVEK